MASCPKNVPRSQVNWQSWLLYLVFAAADAVIGAVVAGILASL